MTKGPPEESPCRISGLGQIAVVLYPCTEACDARNFLAPTLVDGLTANWAARKPRPSSTAAVNALIFRFSRRTRWGSTRCDNGVRPGTPWTLACWGPTATSTRSSAGIGVQSHGAGPTHTHTTCPLYRMGNTRVWRMRATAGVANPRNPIAKTGTAASLNVWQHISRH